MTAAGPARPALARLALVVAVLATVAWVSRWIQDDAYITFRYSENVVSGLGAVWNPGYAVEGYTNFLWMLCMALGLRLGFAAETTSAVLGVACFVVSLLLSFRLARRILGRDDWALLATTLIGTNYSFLMYATGGLETQLNASLTLGVLLLAVEAVDTGGLTLARAATASVMVSLAVMTRPDSALVGAIGMGCLLWIGLRSPARTGWNRAALLTALCAPACLLVGSWLVWKYSLYGRILPNTFYSKVGTRRPGTTLRGVVYVGWLFVTYWWLPIILGLVVVARKRGVALGTLISSRKALLPLTVYAATWPVYVVSIGGDIMEFRHLVAVIPVFILLMIDLCSRILPDVRSAYPVALLLLAGSVVHGAWFEKYVRPDGISAIPILRRLGNTDATVNWKAIGLSLRESLEQDRSVTIAITPAGVIPFLTRARTIDMLGLNDLWVPQHGYDRKLCIVCSGHARLATIGYLKEAGVNLLIGNPQLVSFSRAVPDPAAVVKGMCFQEELDYEALPPDVRLLRIRIHDDAALAVAYMKPHPRIDRLISEGSWVAQPILRNDLLRRAADMEGTPRASSSIRE